MDWSALFRWEWLLIELAVLGLAVFELCAVRRSLRRDRERERTEANARASPADSPESR